MWYELVAKIKRKFWQRFGREHKVHEGYTEFLDLDTAQSWGTETYAYFKACETAEPSKWDNLLAYLGHSHLQINTVLRKSPQLNAYSQRDKSRVHQQAADISDLLEPCLLGKNIIVYRGISSLQHLREVCVTADVHSRSLLNHWFIYPSFTSTALVYDNLHEAFRANIYLRIRCPIGTVGAYMPVVDNKVDEQEFLLNMNQAFVVEDVYRNKQGHLILECVLKDKKHIYHVLRERAENNGAFVQVDMSEFLE